VNPKVRLIQPSLEYTEPKLRWRRLFLLLAWLTYLVFTLTAYPLVGVSVMLPSILLCAFATWLYDYRIGLLTSLLSHPYNMMMMMHHLGSADGWRPALEIGGLLGQLAAIACTAHLAGNVRKERELTKELERMVLKRERDLHDVSDLLTSLTNDDQTQLAESLFAAVANRLKQLRGRCAELHQRLDEAAQPQAAEAGKLVSAAASSIKMVANFTAQRSPSRINEQGLFQALDDLAGFYRESTPTCFTTSCSGQEIQIPHSTATNLYRIANEAIGNALRHGKATHVSILLKISTDSFILEIVNNGIPPPPQIVEGIGFDLMRQRAGQIGASVGLERNPDGNTRFWCCKTAIGL
jgi:signal transduction histidine kinase